MRTDMDYLVLENVVLCKAEQPVFQETAEWKTEFVLD
jgi:carbamoyltransferase